VVILSLVDLRLIWYHNRNKWYNTNHPGFQIRVQTKWHKHLTPHPNNNLHSNSSHNSSSLLITCKVPELDINKIKSKMAYKSLQRKRRWITELFLDHSICLIKAV